MIGFLCKHLRPYFLHFFIGNNFAFLKEISDPVILYIGRIGAIIKLLYGFFGDSFNINLFACFFSYPAQGCSALQIINFNLCLRGY